MSDPYLKWAEQHFGREPVASAAEAAVLWGENADPDGDKLPNLLEYALGLDPLASSFQPTPFLVPVPWLTGDQSAFVISATIRTDDPDLIVVPQVSADNFTWLPFLLDRSDVTATETFYTVKVEETVLSRGVKQITWAARPNALDPHFMRLTALRQSGFSGASAAGSNAASRALKSASALASTPSVPGLLFTGQLNATVGAELVSNTVVLRGLSGSVRVTAPAGVTLVVNGIDRGQSWKVKNGDTLALRTTSPNVGPPSDLVIQVEKHAAATWKVGASRAAALTAPAGTVSGYTPVSASVGGGGDANDSIPITVSPGIGGMEPKLSIGYSSQGGNGPLGIDFNIGGLSAITRVGATQVQDGFRGSVQFNANDRFAMDGARLISVIGADGADGTTYEKELHDFSRIRSVGTLGSGPASWTVETKAGLTFEYGSTPDSQRVGARGASVLVWLVSKVRDTVGNEMQFNYAQESGAYRVTRIDYTSNTDAGKAADNTVEFAYELRPDQRVTYFHGDEVVLAHRLIAIDSKHKGTINEIKGAVTLSRGDPNVSVVIEVHEVHAAVSVKVTLNNQGRGTSRKSSLLKTCCILRVCD